MQATCQECDETFEAQRRTAEFCSPAHAARSRRRRQASARAPGSATAAAAPAGKPTVRESGNGQDVSLLVAATIDELVSAGRLGSALGQAALVLAAKASSSADTGSATAAVIRQWQATFERALAGAEDAEDPVDEIARRRALKASGA